MFSSVSLRNAPSRSTRTAPSVNITSRGERKVVTKPIISGRMTWDGRFASDHRIVPVKAFTGGIFCTSPKRPSDGGGDSRMLGTSNRRALSTCPPTASAIVCASPCACGFTGWKPATRGLIHWRLRSGLAEKSPVVRTTARRARKAA